MEPQLQDIILVAGHSVPVHMDQLDSDNGWFLKDFQAGEGRFYVEHVEAGVRLAAENPESMLVFSGGQTDRLAGPRSEAQGYWLIAEHFDWYGSRAVRNRATTEEFALDSFQNLLFGICRFFEMTGRHPRRITAVGWRFKGARFDIHRAALRWPGNRWDYVGPNDPTDIATAEHFEAQRRSGYLTDPFGSAPEPVAKRGARNPFRRQHGYATSCPHLAELLQWPGPGAYPNALPWDDPLP